MEHYYKEVPGWFEDDDADFYAHLVASVPDGGTIVEVGTWRGRSLSCLLVEARNSGKNLKIYGIDTFKGAWLEPEQRAEALAEDIEAECKVNASRAQYPFTLIKGKSLDATSEFPDKSIDAVFLDGAHDTRSVMEDIRAWSQKVKNDGILSGHDRNDIGVDMALRRLKVNPASHGVMSWYCHVVAA